MRPVRVLHKSVLFCLAPPCGRLESLKNILNGLRTDPNCIYIINMFRVHFQSLFNLFLDAIVIKYIRNLVNLALCAIISVFCCHISTCLSSYLYQHKMFEYLDRAQEPVYIL